MTFHHIAPWTEEEYLALGETTSLVELVRGALWVSPSPSSVIHQTVLHRVVKALEPGANDAGLDAAGQINVRLAHDTITNPDFVIATRTNRFAEVTPAADVHLIGEVTTPDSVLADRSFKPHLYAAAGIEWYLLIEPNFRDLSTTLRLHRLAGDHYVKHAAAKQGQTLKADAPFLFELQTTGLTARSPSA
ncbi:Uma2 family endonuclease [Actinoplanes sp. NPDC026619]|uniref:Uma2 family endonuclease n=1 Tax=Actinoplanes sp. NPDC026619 TaxID=3155798 RepID=UPI0033EDE277